MTMCLNPRWNILCSGFVIGLLFHSSLWGSEDILTLKNGAKLKGKVVSQSDRTVTLEVEVGGKKFTRVYDRTRIQSLEIEGATTGSSSGASSPTRAGGKPLTTREVQQRIDQVGRTPPQWFESTHLDFPDSLDLSWPMPAKGPWNSSINVGQFIWDRVNPNPSKWRSGVKLMHHIMSLHSDDPRIVNQAMMALGNMYHNLHEDYARAAFWWQQAGVAQNPESNPNASVHLADCYRQLGSDEMALSLLNKMQRYPLGVIKLLGDLGETQRALQLAEQFSQGQNKTASLLYAGDVCRVSGDLTKAEAYYRRAIEGQPQDSRNEDYARRERQRAEASLAAIKFYRLKPTDAKEGNYRASSYGYEGPVEVEVVIAAGKIESVKVTQHREKQFYSSIADTPRRIVDRQSLRGIDTTSGATITSEAIINATAKALAQGTQ
jgi:uncharacterized protein with FMN-binding domain